MPIYEYRCTGCDEVIEVIQGVAQIDVLADQHEHRAVGDDQESFTLEPDLDRGLLQKKRRVALARLQGHVPGLIDLFLLPGLVEVTGVGYGNPRAHLDHASLSNLLILYRRGGQHQPGPGAFLALGLAHEQAVAYDDQLFADGGHGTRLLTGSTEKGATIPVAPKSTQGSRAGYLIPCVSLWIGLLSNRNTRPLPITIIATVLKS